MPAVSATTMKVFTPSQNLRRPEESERAPVTGASTAMRNPAIASAQPSCAAMASSSPKDEPVR